MRVVQYRIVVEGTWSLRFYFREIELVEGNLAVPGAFEILGSAAKTRKIFTERTAKLGQFAWSKKHERHDQYENQLSTAKRLEDE